MLSLSCAVTVLSVFVLHAAATGDTTPPVVRIAVVEKTTPNRDAKALSTGDTYVDDIYMHMSPLFNNIGAWSNLLGSEIRAVPHFLKHLPTTFGSWSLPADTLVTFSCPDAPNDIDVCDAWVFYYTCASCNDHQDGPAGGLAALLALDPDWEAVVCAPSFTNGVTGVAHPMRAFRRQLQPGGTAELTLPDVGEFLAFGLESRDSINCGDAQYNTVQTCPVAHPHRCRWEDGVCKNQNCDATHRLTGPGPRTGCPAPCPYDGLRPTQD